MSEASFRSAVSRGDPCDAFADCLESDAKIRRRVQMIADEHVAKPLMTQNRLLRKGYVAYLSRFRNDPEKAKQVYAELIREIEDNVARARRQVANLKEEARETHGIADADADASEDCDTDALFECMVAQGHFVPQERTAFREFVNTSSFALLASLIVSRARVDEELHLQSRGRVFDRIVGTFIGPHINDPAIRPLVVLANRCSLLQVMFGIGSLPVISRLVAGVALPEHVQAILGLQGHPDRAGMFLKYLLARGSGTVDKFLEAMVADEATDQGLDGPDRSQLADVLQALLRTDNEMNEELARVEASAADLAAAGEDTGEVAEEIERMNDEQAELRRQIADMHSRYADAERGGGDFGFDFQGIEVVIPGEVMRMFSSQNPTAEAFVRYVDFFYDNSEELRTIAAEVSQDAGNLVLVVSKDIAGVILSAGRKTAVGAMRLTREGTNRVLLSGARAAASAATSASGAVVQATRAITRRINAMGKSSYDAGRNLAASAISSTAGVVRNALQDEVMAVSFSYLTQGDASLYQSDEEDDEFHTPPSSGYVTAEEGEDEDELLGGAGTRARLPKSMLVTFKQYSDYIDSVRKRHVVRTLKLNPKREPRVLPSPTKLVRVQPRSPGETHESGAFRGGRGGRGEGRPVAAAAGLAVLTLVAACVPR